MMKLNRFLFFPNGSSLSSSPPPPPPWPSPDQETIILDAIFERLREWASTTNITLRPDVFFSLLDHSHVVGATKASTIATLVLVGALFLLSLFFFPGPTLFLLRWLAISCFYFCVFVFGLVWVTCRCLFIALRAICRCLLSFSDDCLIFTGRNSASRDAEYTPLFSGQAIERVIRRPSFLPENRFQQGAGVRYTAPPENRPERGAGVPGNRPERGAGVPGNSCSCGAHGKAPPNYFGERSNNIYRDREKMKETDEYRRAMEAEWAARQQELNRQAEEARRQRSKKAENKRRKTNERRQNQRTDQKKAETSSRKEDENLNNQKDNIREDIRQKLRQLQGCGNMASLLRSLGIHLPFNPSSKEVRAAYRQACKKFHPDRLVSADVRHQIEAEEKFKLISAMKDKCSSL